MSAPPQLAPPARIRVVTHPPLDPLRAWLPLPTHAPGGAPATVRRVLEQAQALLPGHPVLSAELQGESSSRASARLYKSLHGHIL